MPSLKQVTGNSRGARIEALEWRPDTTAAASPFVFVPGGTASAWAGEDLGREVAAGVLGGKPRAVLSVSRRGTGGSEAPASGYAPADFASDVDAVVEAAGYQQFVLFGHSMGVPISLEYVLMRPQKVAGLVLGDTPAAYIDFKAAGTFEKVLSRPYEFPSMDAARDDFALSFSDADEARRVFDLVGHRYYRPRGTGVTRMVDRAAIARTVDESVSAATEYWERLPTINCPVLVLRGVGGWSPLSEEDVARYRMSLSDVTVEYLPGGHQLGLFSHRGPLYAALTRFVAGLSDRS
jgi:pimeloyl-ACP methyl ester carboxylesterase